MQGWKKLARIMLVHLVASWQCGLVYNQEVFRAEADFASDCICLLSAIRWAITSLPTHQFFAKPEFFFLTLQL